MYRSIVFLVIMSLATSTHAEEQTARAAAARAKSEQADARARDKCILSSLRATQHIGIAITGKGHDAQANAKALISTGKALYDCPMFGPQIPGSTSGFSGGGATGSWGGSSGDSGNWGSSNRSPKK